MNYFILVLLIFVESIDVEALINRVLASRCLTDQDPIKLGHLYCLVQHAQVSHDLLDLHHDCTVRVHFLRSQSFHQGLSSTCVFISSKVIVSLDASLDDLVVHNLSVALHIRCESPILVSCGLAGSLLLLLLRRLVSVHVRLKISRGKLFTLQHLEPI